MTFKNTFYSLDFGLAGVYAAVVAVRFKSLLQYRAAALAGISTQIFWGCIKLMAPHATFERGAHFKDHADEVEDALQGALGDCGR